VHGYFLAALVLAFTVVGTTHAHQGHVKFDPKASYIDTNGHVQLYFYNSDSNPRPVIVLIPTGEGTGQANPVGTSDGQPIPPQKGAYINVGVRPNGVTFRYTDQPSDKPSDMAAGQFSPAREPKKPAENSIVGVWRGNVNQPGAPAYTVKMTISSPTAGTTDYPEIKCGGRLSGGPTGPNTYVFDEKITYGRATPTSGGGIDGTITVVLVDDTTMTWSWKGSWQGKEYTASATLKKDGR
jgi:hypothetical protein